jgi:hypothetical protein
MKTNGRAMTSLMNPTNSFVSNMVDGTRLEVGQGIAARAPSLFFGAMAVSAVAAEAGGTDQWSMVWQTDGNH